MNCERARALECGDLSPLLRLWRLVAGPRAAARGLNLGALLGLDGDKSPTESADKSAHSKACDGASSVHS
jgi:hypothetical protein